MIEKKDTAFPCWLQLLFAVMLMADTCIRKPHDNGSIYHLLILIKGVHFSKQFACFVTNKDSIPFLNMRRQGFPWVQGLRNSHGASKKSKPCMTLSVSSPFSQCSLYIKSVGYFLYNPRKFISISFLSIFSSSKLKCPSCLFFSIGKVNLLGVWLKSILSWREAVHNCHRCLWTVVCPSLQLYFLEACLT